jgi:hypothetical protein
MTTQIILNIAVKINFVKNIPQKIFQPNHMEILTLNIGEGALPRTWHAFTYLILLTVSRLWNV